MTIKIHCITALLFSLLIKALKKIGLLPGLTTSQWRRRQSGKFRLPHDSSAMPSIE
jgi:hypothetical protein